MCDKDMMCACMYGADYASRHCNHCVCVTIQQIAKSHMTWMGPVLSLLYIMAYVTNTNDRVCSCEPPCTHRERMNRDRRDDTVELYGAFNVLVVVDLIEYFCRPDILSI